MKKYLNHSIPHNADGMFSAYRRWITWRSIIKAFVCCSFCALEFFFPRHPFFAGIGKKYKETTFYQFPLYKKRTQKHAKGRSVGVTFQGLQLLLDDDKTVREIMLYGEGKIDGYSTYSGGLAGGLDSNTDAAKYESVYGKPIKKGKIDGFDYDLFHVKTDFGMREIEVIYNPDLENYVRYRLITIR